MKQIQPEACSAAHFQNGLGIQMPGKIKQRISTLPMPGRWITLVVVI
jgi:hypothetical protein